MACTGPLIVPFTTMCAACTSPSMRASADTTSVPGWSASAATLPRTMPSTRRPPLKITLPSMRVVTPIRLSIRFCGLLVLLNIFLPSAPSEAHTERCTGLVGTHLVHAHLDAFHLCLRAHPEGALDPPEVLESQPKGCRADVPRLGKAHDSTLPPFRQVDQQLQPAVEITALAGGRCQEQQPVAVFPRQDIGLHLEAVDRQGVRAARLGRQHAFESRQLFPHPGVFLLQRTDLLGELLLGGALDGQAVVGGIRDGPKAIQLGARVLERTARRAQLFLHFAAVEAAEMPSSTAMPIQRQYQGIWL